MVRHTIEHGLSEYTLWKKEIKHHRFRRWFYDKRVSKIMKFSFMGFWFIVVQRTATFFQAVLKGITNTLTDNKFVDCQNNRYGCNGDSNEGCSNTDNCQ